MDEAALVRKLNKGSRFALEQAILKLTPYVGAVICGVLSGRALREDVEELTADVFLTLWNHREELDPGQGLRPWLAAVARNKAKDFLRQSRDTIPLDDAIPLGHKESPEVIAEQREWSERLYAAVESLEEPDRTLFFRYYYQGERLKDVAASLHLGLSAAKQRLLRGRRRLKKQLLEEGADAP